MPALLRTISPAELSARRVLAIPHEVLQTARRIVDDVRSRGWVAVVEWSRKLHDVGEKAEPAIFERSELRRALERIDAASRGVIERSAGRIKAFARAQRDCFGDLTTEIDGIGVGHWLVPVGAAGCYVPGGRFPLPSTALMTAIPARVAGVSQVVIASPRPTDATLAAAAIADADLLVACGGAQAIAAMAFGLGPIAPCDIIVGPGNVYVTAAKQLLFGIVGIDMLAGPTEVLIIADDNADPRLVAADMLAQAEHDDDARALLVTESNSLIQRVNHELARQLSDLPTAATARRALAGSVAVKCDSLDQCIEVASHVAPEHLEIMTSDPRSVAERMRAFGAAFMGADAAEVLGDYAAGPNHVLPTAGTARFASGLSVLSFLNVRTWLGVADRQSASAAYSDAARFAEMEGLIGHQRAARARAQTRSQSSD